jgi:superfamily II RNA helicase
MSTPESQTPHKPHGPPAPALGTPRRHKAPASTRLQGIKPPALTLAQTSAELVSKLNLSFMPDDWQVHLISRIRQGYDSVFLAGTGYGKSLVFEGLAVLGGQSKMVIIISPLKALDLSGTCSEMQQTLS